MPAPPTLLVHAVLIGVSVLFGINFVGMKVVLGQLDAATWALYRIAAATLVLLPLAAMTSRPSASGRAELGEARPFRSRREAAMCLARRRRLPPRRTMLWLVPAAILGVGGNQLLFALGLERTTPSHSSVITACVPILTLAAAALARQERATTTKLIGIGLAFAGVATLLRADDLLADGLELGTTAVGDLLTVANATGYSIFLVMMRRIARDVEAPVATAICFVYATLFVLPFAAPGMDASSIDAITAPDILPWALFAVLGATVATYLLNTWALRHVESSMVALYIYLQPVVATTLSIATGREQPGPRFFAAAALVLAGLLVSTLPRAIAERRRRHRGGDAGRPSGTTTTRPT